MSRSSPDLEWLPPHGPIPFEPWVYDHEYRPAVLLYGAPFLYDGWLGYSDSRSLHICAYNVVDPLRWFKPGDLRDVSNAFQQQPAYIGAWGRLSGDFSLADSHRLSFESAVSSGDIAQVVVLSEQDPRTLSSARRAISRANRLGYSWAASTSAPSAGHYGLLDEWESSHEVSVLHRAFSIACMSSHSNGTLRRIDVFKGVELQGFGLVSLMDPKNLVYLQGYMLRGPGQRVGDCLLNGLIELGIELGVSTIHLGYSGTPGLLSFKEKWGGIVDERSRYGQVALTRRDVVADEDVEPEVLSIRSVYWLRRRR